MMMSMVQMMDIMMGKSDIWFFYFHATNIGKEAFNRQAFYSNLISGSLKDLHEAQNDHSPCKDQDQEFGDLTLLLLKDQFQ